MRSSPVRDVGSTGSGCRRSAAGLARSGGTQAVHSLRAMRTVQGPRSSEPNPVGIPLKQFDAACADGNALNKMTMLVAAQARIPQVRDRAWLGTVAGNPHPVSQGTATMQPVVRSDSALHSAASVFICVASAFIRVPLGCAVANTNSQGFPKHRHPGQHSARGNHSTVRPRHPLPLRP